MHEEAEVEGAVSHSEKAFTLSHQCRQMSFRLPRLA